MSRFSSPWHPLRWMVPAFLLVVIVNGIMIYKGVTTFSGTTSEHAYEEGLTYNATLARQAEQNRLGWAFTVEADRNSLTLAGKDASGQPLTGATVTVLLQRPTTQGHDASLPLAESTPGTYTAPLNLPLPGQWQATFTVTRGEQTFTFGNRLNPR